jgi:hypothetical protein
VFHIPILRVQSPLYRQGLVTECRPAAGFPMAAALAWVPPFSVPLSGRRLLYKVPLSPGPAYSGYMPPACLGSFHGERVCLARLVEAMRGWRHSGLQPLPLLRALATFNKAMVKGFVLFAGLGLRWRTSQLTNVAAGSSVEAGLLCRMSRRSLG